MKKDAHLILGFGDSLTAGTPGYDPTYSMGDVRSQYGFWLLNSAKKEHVANLEFINMGAPGELASMMYSRLKTILNEGEYDIVVILGGTNDIGWGHDVEQVYRDLERLWGLALGKGADTVACTIPPIAERFGLIQAKQTNLNERILRSAQLSDRMTVVDVFSALVDSNGLLPSVFDSGDGLHLSVEGYRRLGEVIWREGIRALM